MQNFKVFKGKLKRTYLHVECIEIIVSIPEDKEIII